LLEQFEVNVQMIFYGKGTANSQMLARLGLIESDKAILISCIREDMVKDALEMLSDDNAPAQLKNNLLKACIERIEYSREKPVRNGRNWTEPPINIDVKLKL
jgi:hypothetical protein